MNRQIIILALGLCTCAVSDLQRAIQGVQLARELAEAARSTACKLEGADQKKCDAAKIVSDSASEILEVVDELAPEEETATETGTD